MKKIIVIIALLACKMLSAQDLVLTTLDFSKIDANKKFPAIADIVIDSKDAQRFLDAAGDKNAKDKIEVIVLNKPATVTIKINDVPATVEGDKTYIGLTETIQKALDKSSNLSKSFSVVLKYGTAADVASNDFKVSWADFIKADKNVVNTTSIDQGKLNRDKVITAFKKDPAFLYPYNNKKDRVDLFFDENGKLLNYLPVNVDQNDIFYMHIVCAKGDEEKYRVNITEGEFSPSDLAIRPFTKIGATTTGSGTGNKEELVPIEYTSIVLHAGPYTTDSFRFQIAYDSIGKETNGLLYSLKINKLYHVGVGVSMISSGLQNPSYKTFFNGTDTTIRAFDSKRRTLFTFNVIWYWSVLHQKKEGSVIPNGRDVMKDEPTFSIARVFPTVGVSIDNAFKENFFLGAVYEFARGGSLTLGMHYGRVNVLADKDFVLEKTKFSGTDADIKLDQVYKAGFYVGLNVDTRILNLLFSKGQ